MKLVNPFKSRVTPITRVSFKYVESASDAYDMICNLAWQLTLGNILTNDIRPILKGEKTFKVPEGTRSQLTVRPFVVYNGDHYEVDDDRMPNVAAKNGKKIGCFLDRAGRPKDFEDPDDGYEFVEFLDYVEEIYGKMLDEQRAKRKSRNTSQDEDKEPRKVSRREEQEETPRGTRSRQPEPEAETEAEGIIIPGRELYDIWHRFTDDNLVRNLKTMSYGEREGLFEELVDEYDTMFGRAADFFNEYVAWLGFIANAVSDFNGPKSAAAKFKAEMKEQEQEQTRKGQSFDDLFEEGYLDPESPIQPQPQQKANPPKTEQGQRNHDAYIERQQRYVQRQMKQDGLSTMQRTLLSDMMEALRDGDANEYNQLKAEYELSINIRAAMGESQDNQQDTPQGQPQPNQPKTEKGKQGSKKQGKGKDKSQQPQQSQQQPSTPQPDSQPNTQPEPPQSEPTGDATDEELTDLTFGDVIDVLELAGKDIPKAFILQTRNGKITRKSVNRILERNGIDYRF